MSFVLAAPRLTGRLVGPAVGAAAFCRNTQRSDQVAGASDQVAGAAGKAPPLTDPVGAALRGAVPVDDGVSPSTAHLAVLPLALIPVAAVPLAMASHIRTLVPAAPRVQGCPAPSPMTQYQELTGRASVDAVP